MSRMTYLLLETLISAVADGAGQAGEAHDKAHDVGAGNQEHDDSGGLAGVQQDLGQILDLMLR